MPSVDVEATVNALAWMLLRAALLGILAWRINLPYAVVLVLGALAVEESHLVALPRFEPRVLLFVFLPPLLFDAAFRLDDVQLRSLASGFGAPCPGCGGPGRDTIAGDGARGVRIPRHVANPVRCRAWAFWRVAED